MQAQPGWQATAGSCTAASSLEDPEPALSPTAPALQNAYLHLNLNLNLTLSMLPQARAAEGDLAAAAAARDAALLEARHTAEAAASAAATAARAADALRSGAGADREQALAALQARACVP